MSDKQTPNPRRNNENIGSNSSRSTGKTGKGEGGDRGVRGKEGTGPNSGKSRPDQRPDRPASRGGVDVARVNLTIQRDNGVTVNADAVVADELVMDIAMTLGAIIFDASSATANNNK